MTASTCCQHSLHVLWTCGSSHHPLYRLSTARDSDDQCPDSNRTGLHDNSCYHIGILVFRSRRSAAVDRYSGYDLLLAQIGSVDVDVDVGNYFRLFVEFLFGCMEYE